MKWIAVCHVATNTWFPRLSCVILCCLLLSPCWTAQAGNLIENSSFEAGIDSHFAIARWYVDGLPNAVLDEQTQVHGRYSLRLPLSRIAYTRAPRSIDGIAFRSAQPVVLEAGNSYIFSAYARADHLLEGKLLLTTAGPGSTHKGILAEKPISVFPQWRRVYLDYTPEKNEHVYWEINVRSDEPGVLWMDGLQLEAGSHLTDYRPMASIEASITSDKPGKIFTSGEAPEISLRLFNDDVDERPDISFDLSVYNLAGARVHQQELTRSLAASSGSNTKIRLPVFKNGIYRVELTRSGQQKIISELHLSVLPEPRDIPADVAAFGAYTTLSPEPLKIMQRLGFTWVANLTSNGRMIYWDFVEPEPGLFLWYDDDVDMAQKTGAEMMFNLEPCKTPAWARKLPRKERIEKWKNYVSQMVKHYGSVVKHWTIADESHSFRTNSREKNCWGNSAEYVDWHMAGVEAIRGVDPDAKIIMNTSAEFADAVLSKLPKDYVNILGGNFFHVKNGMNDFSVISEKYGIPEIWAPGVGPSSRSFYYSHIPVAKRKLITKAYWDDKNTELVKQVVEAMGAGARKIFHYTATYVGNTNGFSIFEADSSLKPLGAQYGVLAWFLDGLLHAKELVLEGYDENISAYRFDRADGMTVFPVWGLPARQQIFTFPRVKNVEGIDVYDSFGNVIESQKNDARIRIMAGKRPVFILVATRDANKVEQSLKKVRYHMQQFPEAWNVTIRGDYAVVQDAVDEYYRPAPNVSFWYRSEAAGWIEVLRSRSSTYQPRYELNDLGLKISWAVAPRPGSFYLEPGLLPKSFLHGAEVHHLSGKPGAVHTIKNYRIDLDRYEKVPLSHGLPVAGVRAPNAIIIKSTSGLTQIIETWYEGMEAVDSGVWGLDLRKDLDQSFLHRWIRNKPEPSPVKISVQVSVKE